MVCFSHITYIEGPPLCRFRHVVNESCIDHTRKNNETGINPTSLNLLIPYKDLLYVHWLQLLNSSPQPWSSLFFICACFHGCWKHDGCELCPSAVSPGTSSAPHVLLLVLLLLLLPVCHQNVLCCLLSKRKKSGLIWSRMLCFAYNITYKKCNCSKDCTNALWDQFRAWKSSVYNASYISVLLLEFVCGSSSDNSQKPDSIDSL